MTLRELELFYHLSDNPHISALSKKLSLSQSAISLAIKSLEKKLSEPLFDRIGKKLILNERGRLFKEQSYKHYLALKESEEFFKKDRVSGVLKIASSKTIGEFIIPSIVYDFLLQNSHVRVEKDIKNSATIINLVLEGAIDMGIIETECVEPNIVKIPISEDRLVVVTSDKTFAKKTVYIDQLFSKKWILREKGSGTRELFLDALGELTQELEIFMEFTEFEEMKTLLQNCSDVISCVSYHVVQKELERGELFEVGLKNIRLNRRLYAIHHKDKYKTTLFDSFLAILVSSCDKKRGKSK